MKSLKFIYVVTILFLSPYLYAQNQESGSVTLELEFAPLGSEPLKINSLRARYFLNETLAFRTSVFIGGNRNTSKSFNSDSTLTFTNTNGAHDLSIRPGIERHFALSSRLSSYVGAEFFYGYNSSRP